MSEKVTSKHRDVEETSPQVEEADDTECVKT